jgi:MoxR-like ATPase
MRGEPVGLSPDETVAAEQLRTGSDRILAECAKVIVGQQDVLELLLIALLGQGHALLVGVPGLAKTLMIRTLADSMNLTFNRVQFTPDLMPSDITGTEMLQEDRATGQRAFRFLHGPIFANVVLADEINRTPPKTQAALLEAMQERQVTVAGTRHKLPDPFFVLATQNPIEQEGTYPLPEAQQDRFMFTVTVNYPNEEDEFRVIESTTSAARPRVDRVISGDELLAMQALVRKVPAAGYVIRYALKLARLTRPHGQEGEPPDPNVPDFVKKYVTWGAGPRAGQNLILAAKARALLHGRPYVAVEDVRAVALPVMRHRVITNYAARADNVTTDELIRKLLKEVPAREGN